MELEEAIRIALDGDAVLFLGAGFSHGATNLEDKCFKTGPELAAHLAVASHIAKTNTLEDAADAFVELYGEDKLIQEIKHEFTAKAILDWHQGIAAIPWRRVYTTNYDNVVELAFAQEGKPVTSVTLSSDVYAIPKDSTCCIHMNGYVATLDRMKIKSELKLTESSYITASIADSQWAMLFRQDLRLARAVFFIGYSLSDLDIKRILFENEQVFAKTFFYVGRSASEATCRRASKFGTVIKESTEQFVANASVIGVDFVQTEKTLLTLSLQECLVPEPTSQITDKAFIDLLLYGKCRGGLVSEAFRTDKRFYLERKAIDEIFAQIAKGNRVIVLCSDLGNGKSMLLEGLRVRAIEQGYRVFDANDYNPDVDREFEAVARISGKLMVTVENYQNWLDAIRVFSTNATDQAVLILTARNGVNDVLIDDLAACTGVGAISEINIDILKESEIDWLVTTFNEYGLWGEHAGDSHFNKQRFISNNCKSQFHALLLRLFDSPDIQTRLSSITEQLTRKGVNYELLLTIFILSVLNQSTKVDVLADICGPEIVNSSRFKNDLVIKELINFNYSVVSVRSSVIAEHILKTIPNVGTVVTVLTKIVKQLAKGAAFSPNYRNMCTELMRFSSLQIILPEKGRHEAVIRFYESIKNLDICKSHPLFWLQYAIASLVIEDISRAETYFDTAYSLAARRGWDNYQIDNHFARFLMVQAIQKFKVKDAILSFRKAKAIINRQITSERRYYPYRVAISYQDFIDRFGSELSNAEIEEIAQASKLVLERIEALTPERRKHRYIIDCHKSLNYVVRRAAELVSARRGKIKGSEAK